MLPLRFSLKVLEAKAKETLGELPYLLHRQLPELSLPGFVELADTSQEKYTSRPRRPRASNYPFVPIPQIDEDTASLMSGVQGSNSTPSLLLSEAGKF